MTKSKYFLFLSLFILSCKSQENDIYELDPRTFIENKITLADIADDIKYVPIENNIPFISFKYVITPNYFYFAAKGIGILKFDRRGRLIKKIGSQGRGPGEFMFGINFTVNEKTGNVFVIDRSSIIKVYSKNGTFLRDILLNEIGDGVGWGGDIEIFNSLLFLSNSLGQGNSKYNWVFLDTLGKMVAKKENSVPPFQTKTGRDACIYKFENRLFYYNFFNDTIFSISPDLSYYAAYLFAQGDHRWPKITIKYNSISNLNSQITKLFDPWQMFETKYFIVLQYGYLNRSAIAFIDKKLKKIFLALKIDKSSTEYLKLREYKPYLVNDLDGGMALEKLGYYYENNEEFFTSLVTAFELKTYVSSKEFINSKPKYPEKKKELEKLADSLKESDNPVLMMVD